MAHADLTFGDWVVLYLDDDGVTVACDVGAQALLLQRWTVAP